MHNRHNSKRGRRRSNYCIPHVETLRGKKNDSLIVTSVRCALSRKGGRQTNLDPLASHSTQGTNIGHPRSRELSGRVWGYTLVAHSTRWTVMVE